jgi:hypothetical protein
MFSFDSTIDAIQNGKKAVINQFVTDSTLAKSLNEVVDAQTGYVKSVLTTSRKAAEQIGNEVLAAQQEVMSRARTTAEEIMNKASIKDLTEKATKDLFDSFWKDAFKWQVPATASASSKKSS